MSQIPKIKDCYYYSPVNIPSENSETCKRIKELWLKIEKEQQVGLVESYFLFSLASNGYTYMMTRDNQMTKEECQVLKCHYAKLMYNDLKALQHAIEQRKRLEQ